MGQGESRTSQGNGDEEEERARQQQQQPSSSLLENNNITSSSSSSSSTGPSSSSSSSSGSILVSGSSSAGSSFVDILLHRPEDSSKRSNISATSSIDTTATTTMEGVKKPPQRVAVIGGGVSGLAAAWHLSQLQLQDDENGHSFVVELFERDDRLGGHAWTVELKPPPVPQTDAADATAHANANAADPSQSPLLLPESVDIGFMVFNDTNYPNMVAWFRALDAVETEPSDMSLSVSLDKGRTVEWSSDPAGACRLLWQCRPRCVWSLVSDLLRFHATAAADLLLLPANDPRRHVTVQQYLRQHGYSTAFATYYLLPMMAALWSASLDDVLHFPAAQLAAFLCHHQMLQLWNRPAWRTVTGRSASYVHAAAAAILPQDQGTKHENVNENDGSEKNRIHCQTPIHSMEKMPDGTYKLFAAASPTTDGGSAGVVVQQRQVGGGCFDHVIFACHAPTAAAILERSRFAVATTAADTTADALLQQTRDLLRAIEYADNVVYVHSDPALMPVSPTCWASWNCLGKSDLLQLQQQQQQGQSTASSNQSKRGEAFEGAESGFGAKKENVVAAAAAASDDGRHLEGADGRFKAVYVTYWLNRLQNLQGKANVFVSLNPHQAPDPALTHKRVVMAHPQFNPRTLLAREQLLGNNSKHQGANGLWFCGAWSGFGFHEDGCRSGFEVATALSGVPLPWAATTTEMVLPPPDLTLATVAATQSNSMLSRLYKMVSYDLPVAVCKKFIYYFLDQAVQNGTLRLKFNDGSIKSFGDGTPCGCDSSAVTLRIFDPWFFVKTALEYDLGLARSYMAGLFVVEPLEEPSLYHPVIRPADARDETTIAIGDPIGLTRLFLLLIGNRDRPLSRHVAKKSGRGHSYSGAFTNASGLLIGKIGSLFNYLRYKMTMDNSERGGSLKNIHAHYDLSNDLFTTFLDKETIMYSSAIYEAVKAPSPQTGLMFRGTLEDAQWRKLDTLLDRAQVQPGQTLLDIGFGWGGLSIHAAKKYGCRVTGITLSVEQKALAEKRVKEEGLQSLVTFEVVDYRTFARRKENQGKFDRVLSCEMIEAVGHKHLGEFFWVVEQVLAHDGVLVMEAITTPEERYETYIRSTDFINTIIFPGSCCPSLHALIDAVYQQSSLTLEHIDNIGLHYAQTLAEWRRRFNASEATVRSLGFDDVFLRAWNYYLTYCEAGFFSQTENCLILVFSRPGCKSLVPLCETRSVTQPAPLSLTETSNWVTDGIV